MAGPLRYLLFSGLCAGTFLTGAVGALLHDDGRIAAGVYIHGVAVAGLTPAEARSRVAEAVAADLPGSVEMRGAGRTWRLEAADFGQRALVDQAVERAYRLGREGSPVERGRTLLALAQKPRNLGIKVEVDRARLEALLTNIAGEVDREPQDAHGVRAIGDMIYFARDEDGLQLDLARTADAVAAEGKFPPPAAVDLVLERRPARFQLAEVQRDISTLLSHYSTDMKCYGGVIRDHRRDNVKLCLTKINGWVLAPGEEWSFNDRIGPRGKEDGYKWSWEFHRRPDGSVEDRIGYGGGVCQLATTIFNAALRSDLDISDRHNHALPVHYVPYGRDATVYYGVVDLKFVNTLEHPIMLWGEVDDNYILEIKFFGHPDDRCQVELNGYGTVYRTVRRLDGTVVKDREFICSSSYGSRKKKS